MTMMTYTSRPMTDDERRLFGAEFVRKGIEQLRHAVHILDGLEWSPLIERSLEDLEFVARRCKEYAK